MLKRLHNMLYSRSGIAEDDPRFFIVTYADVAPETGEAIPYATKAEYAEGEKKPVVIHSVFQVRMGLN